jgi:hypothetical protein
MRQEKVLPVRGQILPLVAMSAQLALDPRMVGFD